MPVMGGDPDANNAFPYFINCYRGVAEDSNADGGGGDEGGQNGPPDDDGDHVGNGWDMCADTGDTTYPDGDPIYPRGCTESQYGALSSDEQNAAKIAYAGDSPPAPPDEDGDGIPDPLDDCENTEAGNLVYADGCAHLESSGNETAPDRDNDGIADDEDTCPDENASGYDADANGCIDDSDSDGVKDDVDVCPFDANDGCPAALQDVEGNVTEEVPGCIHQSAENYNPDATEDDGSCTYEEDTPGFGIMVALISIIGIAFRRRN